MVVVTYEETLLYKGSSVELRRCFQKAANFLLPATLWTMLWIFGETYGGDTKKRKHRKRTRAPGAVQGGVGTKTSG